ncbi:hypothetical protein A5756_20050 [Mycobacterium sp. 852002-53434_SCH5985345]|uniref:hypothetical protein n=1 Tax=unclassified Mycobacterium TaxID=2642494 RepID=UPI0008019B57|nr:MULTISPECIES: hypothetical protein [unclassified Mycobacterium]OBF51283.1 hypothetical protein A5756_20050 [Mycobacterium sp. 852002-53434_SCH5985345]OBF71495.1 hypothetical protein A5750_20230 [Mycobacterium sp. 852002-51613_SCH5001154]OBF89974.1 hypothetical protein A5773_02880 [Mycobacterium sp. 852014-52450_SCH5900713]
MTTTQRGDVLASGDDGRPSSGEAKAAGQPPITPGAGLISTDWLPGPSDSTRFPVVVSFTDFHSESEQDWQQVAELGLRLAQSWPIMHGAVGLWLWGKPAECRGGSLSVWDSRSDLRRFIRWPVHAEIVKNWRGRVRVESVTWTDERFVPTVTWGRAEEHMRMPRHMSAGRQSGDD